MFSITLDSQGFYAKPRQPRLLLLPRPLNSRHPTLRRSSGRHDLVFKKPLVRLHWKSQRSSRSHSRLLLFRGALPLAPAGIEDQLNELHLNPPAQNSPHAIVPDAKATPEIAPAAESEGSATAEAIEVPSAVEGPSPAAPKDELVTITSAASVRNGPSESAGSEGLTPVLVPPQS
jgi:hypothetical protein